MKDKPKNSLPSIGPDENHQFLCTDSIDGIFLEYDAWSLELACKLITIGSPVDIVDLYIEQEETLYDPGEDMSNYNAATDKLTSTLAVYERARVIAQSSTKLNLINDPDSPAKWIAWAKSKGYSVTHLLPPDSQTIKSKPSIKGISKAAVINAFEGLHFDRNGWNNALSDVPKWIEICRVTPGRKGDNSSSATWNPALIASALLDKHIPIKKLDAVFVNLKEWQDEWREASVNER